MIPPSPQELPFGTTLHFHAVVKHVGAQTTTTSKAGDIIVDAGPAGAYLAYLLARNGTHAAVLDDSHPREKPYGGAISPFALRKYPILEVAPNQP